MFRQSWVRKHVGHYGRWAAIAALCLLVLLVASYAAPTMAGPAQSQADVLAKIEPLVLEELADRSQTDYFIWLTEKADLSPAADLPTKEAKGQFVFEALTSTAERTQQALRAYLDSQGANYRPYYISNKILVRGGNEAMLMEVAARSDVARVTANHVYQLPEPIISPAPEKWGPSGIEPNLTFVNADDVWAAGYTGAGIVLAGNDTGLDWDHPALINQYRGWNGTTADHNYNWWDATGTYPTVPNDGHGHGTHTTGTMVGDDGGSNRIGIAPGAQTIHCKNMTNSGNGTDDTFTECFEFDLAPWDLNHQNPMPSLAPHAVNNSWGIPGGNAPQFIDEVDALQAAGILVEASAGNEGPSCATLRSPGDYDQTLTTGSVSHAGGSLPGSLTGFSSRGVSDVHPSAFIPDVMAPGENINSSIPGGGYSGPTWSGTSMSGPHVTGLIALMWEASPALVGNIDTTVQAIIDTAVPLTGVTGSNCGGNYTTGPNNDWGYGTINAMAAVNEAILQGGPQFTLEATPVTQAICAPNSAVYEVTVGQILGFNSPVDMSAQGHPAGTTANFAPDPVTAPNTTILTIGNTGSATAGSYTIDIIGTTATKTVEIAVGLDVFTAAPGSVTLNNPANGATGVSLAPTYAWSAASQGGSYEIQVATDAGFSNIVYSATVDGTTHKQTSTLNLLTTYYWRVRAVNTCGNGSYSSTFSFTTTDVLPILLVDDDSNSPDVRSYYTTALDNLGLLYDIWDTGSANNEPTETDLAAYGTVIWFTGVQFGGSGNPIAGPGAAAAAALGNWLDDGNCMFLSSQDYYYDFGLTSFMDTYLGVASATSDVTQQTVTGAGSVFGGLGPYSLSYPFSNYSDQINPDADAEVAFTGNAGNAAVNKDNGVYRTTYWGFPFEAIPTQNGRDEAMAAVVDFCGAGGPTGRIEGQVTDADTNEPIVGAAITADSGSTTRTTYTDENGEYGMTVAIGIYDVTAEAENYVSETVNDVEVLTDTIEIVDFSLQGSWLTYNPSSIQEDMEIGDVVTNTVTVINTGPLPIDYSVSVVNYGGPTIPPSDGNFPRGAAAPSAGPAPAASEGGNSGGPVLQLAGGALAYGLAFDLNDFSADLLSFTTDAPTAITELGDTGGDLLPAGDFLNGDFSKMYALDYDTNQFITVNTSNGSISVVGPAAPNGSGHAWAGMAGDPTDNTLYATSCNISETRLYTIDPATGAKTEIGVGSAPCLIGIAINSAGEMYGLDIVNDALYSVNKSTGATTMIGSIGFDANYSQGMDFDEESGILYLAAYNNSTGSGELRIADVTTGNSTVVGLFGSGNWELNTMAVATGGAAGGWAYAVPNEGTIPPNSSSTFDVVFDATSLYQVGSYTAELKFSGTFVNDVPNMPLLMNISCSTCGFMNGSITDAFTNDPLVAQIDITGPNGFEVSFNDDAYELAVPAGTYHIVVSADGYFSEEADVNVTQGGTVTTDFALTPVVATLEVSTSVIERELLLGESATTMLVLTNTGTAPLEFELNDFEVSSPIPSGINVSIPASDGNFPRGAAAPSAGPAPAASEGGNSGGPVLQLAGGALAYGLAFDLNDFSADLLSFTTDAPTAITELGDTGGDLLPAGDFLNGDFSKMYALDYDTNQFITVDTSNGSISVVGPAAPNGSGHAWTGMAADPTDNTLYAASCNISETRLYTINPATGAKAEIGVGSAPCLIGIAISSTGEMYGLDIVNDALYSVNKSTGATTMIGSIGFDANYSQGMDFDEESGILYLAAYNNSTGLGELRIADVTTGNSTVVGLFGSGNWELNTMAVATGGASDAIWATESPASGTIEPGESVQVAVVFDSSVVSTTGTYEASLVISGDFDNDVDSVALIMHVTDELVADVAISDDQTGSGLMGTDVEYTFTVTNLGNATDSFELEIASAWPAELSATNTGPLAPGASFDVTVTVHVPTGLTDGSMSIAVLTATSSNDPNTSDTAQATTTAYALKLYLPAILYNE